jgi:hypothetical protein
MKIWDADMTDEQLKNIASMTLLNSSIISRLASGYASLIEKVLPLLPEKEQAAALKSDLEQVHSLVANLQASLKKAGKELGLE